MIFRFILWAVIIVLVLRFITRFLFPIFQITKSVSNKMRDMQDQMEQLNKQQQQQQQRTSQPKSGEYIDYEEVK